MSPRSLLLLVCALLAGVAAGWFAAPRHRPAQGAPDAALKERAAQYYRGSKSFDFASMMKLITPARQLAEQEALAARAAEMPAKLAEMKEDERKDLLDGAASISAERISVDIEGDWAVTSGTFDMRFSGKVKELPLERLVWVRDHGQWWMYELTNAELKAYGNPPDFALTELEKREKEYVQTGQADTGAADSAGEAAAEEPAH